MAKKILGYVKLQVPAGAATPSPPSGRRGAARRQHHGLRKEFNARTGELEKGTPAADGDHRLPGQVLHLHHQDAAGDLYLKRAAKLTSGSKLPGREVEGKVTMKQCREIAELKMKDLNDNDIDQAPRSRRLRPLDGPRSGGE